ncbi:MAG TPA: hypothetical protein VHX38_16875 [Pseudonocardiaceae bacterium]|nr:hypothetical protein [Pseudonocardiaceae bacterium]
MDANSPMAAITGLLVLLEVVFIMPTVGLVRLAIYRAHGLGWCIQARYGTPVRRVEDPTVELQTQTKRQAQRLRQVIQHELDHGANFNAPSIQTAVARNNAFFRPATPPPPVTSGTI